MKKHPETLSEQQKNLTAWRATLSDIIPYGAYITLLYFSLELAVYFADILSVRKGFNEVFSKILTFGTVITLFIGSIFLKNHHYQKMFNKESG